MLFFEYSFLFLFLPVVLLGHQLLPPRARNPWLLGTSLVFYATSSWTYLPLLLLAIVADYELGRRIARAEGRAAKRAWLSCSVAMNLGLLGYYKYAGLVTSTLHAVWPEVPIAEAALPIGISFFTFQSMSYPIDLYRGQTRPARSLVDFAMFVSLFPQLVAGPIVRYHDLAEEVLDRASSAARFALGLQFFVAGLAKKLLLADTAASFADPLFASSAPGMLEAWAAISLYAAQIYFDFSAYSDMAIGLGHMLGFTFPKNFDSPYKARSFSEFWRRWHITLSGWLRDNLYIPLGGGRRGPVRTQVNLLVTMLLGGLWHGASWTFLAWGGYHGLLLAAERALAGRVRVQLPAPVQRGLVFLGVVVGWVFFRIDAFDRALGWLAAMAGAHGLGSLSGGTVAVTGLALYACHVPKNTGEWRQGAYAPLRAVALTAAFAAALLVGYGRGSSPFLYFRF